MKLKKAIVTGTVAAAFVGSVLNVSAAEMTTKDYMNALKESGKENLIIDVDAYKAAYSDLAAAFGDDRDAYLEHYLTYGIYENRMEGALFDPLTYAEAYGDIKAAYGDNILAIANHYVTVGVTENRTIGTANGYADIATAEKAGAVVNVSRASRQVPGNVAITANAANGSDVQNASETNGDSADAVNSNNVAVNVGGSNNVANTSAASANAAGNTSSNGTANASANTVNNAVNNTAPAASPSVNNETNYQHVTTIYHDDGETLWRKEYYDENNKIAEYSSITDVDNSTNSYTENVYKWDDEKNEEVLQRTDKYENGELVSSERP